MRQLTYALRFMGRAAPVGDAATVLKATTSAPSCAITTICGPGGVGGEIAPAAGQEATFESEVTFTGESTFTEAGTIAFGRDGHRLRFSTVGEGRLGPSADPRLTHGTVMWRIDGGEGQFAGASGLITSNFTVSETSEVVDHHFGVLFVR